MKKKNLQIYSVCMCVCPSYKVDVILTVYNILSVIYICNNSTRKALCL